MKAASRAKRWWWPVVGCAVLALIWPATELWMLQARTHVDRLMIEINVGPGWIGIVWDTPQPLPKSTLSIRGYDSNTRRQLANPGVFSASGFYRFLFPAWLISAACAIFAAGWIVSHHRAAGRKLSGLCPICGYDLRATPDRCPECGYIPALST